MNPRPIRFYHRGAVVEVDAAVPTRSVLDWLREDARCTGTKEGCNEGDCGACTVVVGEIAAAGDADAVRGLKLSTVNACIRFLPTLDGRALFTVEDLKALNADRLHPVQQAMVDCHGSQCGFCTPGFVMSLWNAYEQHTARETVPSRQQLADELAGNLCRCTGYRPILDAGQRMFDLPLVALDTAPVLEALTGLRRVESFDAAGRDPVGRDIASRDIASRDFASRDFASRDIASRDSAGRDPAVPPASRFHAPTTLAELAALRLANPTATLLAGSTDIGLWVTKQFRPLGDILFIGEVAEMKRIEERDDALRIGAGASLEAAWGALVARLPSLTDVFLRFASPPIRHAGTMGGNVANGSPIGDSPPVLMALDADIELRRGDAVRRLPLAGFYVDYLKNRMEPGEFVQALIVPPAAMQRQVRAYKISKRFDSDISALLGAFAVELDAGGKVGAIRLAFGGMAAVCKRAAGAEAAILGQPWTQATVDSAKAALAADFKPLTDMRASAGYRMQVAQNLLQRFWLETRTENPLPAAATSVYSGMPHVVALSSGPSSASSSSLPAATTLAQGA